MDKILIKDLKLYAFHGVNPEEKVQGQHFLLDIEAEIDLSKAGITDDLQDTVSYAKIIKTVRRVFTEEINDLLERAAQRVADTLLTEYPLLESVKILLKKPEAPIQADFDYVGIEIVRKRPL
jgi:dihydroneopterin aldolase